MPATTSVAQASLSDVQMQAADLSGDSRITAADLTLLKRQLTARARGTKNFSIKMGAINSHYFASENSLLKFFRTYYVRKTV